MLGINNPPFPDKTNYLTSLCVKNNLATLLIPKHSKDVLEEGSNLKGF